ncbi:MAG: T9SS type A sorting domain-containing protein [Candidatus Cloacimonetes bacterium]|nr:T9SS type A sorting domain-containing protein [Candidatus Cloacimonadota bacterium]
MTIAITKLDPQGNLQWRRYIDPGIYQYISITGVDIDNDDRVTFIITCFGGSIIQVGSISSAGVINFLSIPFEIPLMGITFNKALRTLNGDIVAVGKASQNYDVSSACFFRFTATGDTLATAFWPVDQGSQYHEAEAYDLALMDNGNFLITCSLHTSLGSIIEVNGNGEIVNRINVPDNYLNVYSCLALGRSYTDGSYLLASSFGFFPNVMVKVFRLLGHELTLLFELDNNVIRSVSSLFTYQNGIYICGTAFNGTLVNLSLSGELSWTWNHPGDNICPYIGDGFGSPSTALLGLDSLGCVYWAWGNSGQQVIIKLLPNGQVPVQDDVQTSPVNLLTAYPNPMTNLITIKATNDDPSLLNASIDIFNIKGQLVRTLKLSNREANWDGKDDAGLSCPRGIYLIRSGERKNRVYKICKIN